MTWPNFGALGAAWLALLFIPLILFYFLKLRRPRVEISSLVLWQSVLEDHRVNSPFQKFKRNLLLLLQLLLLLLLILAAMQPYIPSDQENSDYLPIIIDNSASMGAIDKPGGKTRLELAKEQIRDYLDKQSASRGMFTDAFRSQKIYLISYSTLARRLQDFTDNKNLLHDALDKLKVDDLPGDPNEALQIVKALARRYDFDRVVLFSDGNFPSRVDFELPFNLEFKKILPATENIGITDLVAKRAGPDSWDVLTRVEASADANVTFKLRIFQDGVDITADDGTEQENLAIAGGQARRFVYNINADKPSRLEFKLDITGFDALPADNIAYLDLPEARPLQIIADDDLKTYQFALSRLDHLKQILSEDAEVGNVDLIITQKEEIDKEAPITLHVGVIPKDIQPLVTMESGEQDEIIDWRKDHPLLQHVILDDLVILNKVSNKPEVSNQNYEQLGYDIIAEGTNAPLIISKRSGLQEHVYTLFHTTESTLPYRIGFPVMVYNLVQEAMIRSDLAEIKGYKTGTLPELPLTEDAKATIKNPDNSTITYTADPDGILRAIPAPYAGLYTVSTPDIRHERSVSLLNATETSLVSVDSIQFKELTIEAGTELHAETHLWYWLALGAFLFLIIEWWYFNRKVGGIAE